MTTEATTVAPILQLPLEVWHSIVEFFRVSQLGSFARVSWCWYRIQERLPAWKTAIESDGLASFAKRQHRRMCFAAFQAEPPTSTPPWFPVVARDVANYLFAETATSSPASSSMAIATHRDAYVAIARLPEFGRLLVAPAHCLPHGEHPELLEQLGTVGCSTSNSCLFALFESLWSQFEDWLLRNGLLAQYATLEPVDFDTSTLPEALAAMLLVGGRQGLRQFRFPRETASRLRDLATPASPSHLSLLSLLPESLARWNIPLDGGDFHHTGPTRRGRRDEGENDGNDIDNVRDETSTTTVVSTSPTMALFGVARYYHTCLPRWYTTHSLDRSTIDTGEGVIFAFLYVSVMHVIGVVTSVPDAAAQRRDEEYEMDDEDSDYEDDNDEDEEGHNEGRRVPAAARMQVGQVVFLSLHHARHPVVVAPNLETFFYHWVRDVCWLKRFDLDSSRRSISLYPRIGHPRVHGVSVAVTRGVEVIMSPIYLYDSSQPFKRSFRYAYQCRMRLLPSSPFSSVQLTHRRWVIQSGDPSGVEEVVEGEGVIGLFPILHRMTENEAQDSDAERGLGYGSMAQSTFDKLFFYASCTNFESSVGFMSGAFRFVPGTVEAPLGLPFDATVAPFQCRLSESENALYGEW